MYKGEFLKKWEEEKRWRRIGRPQTTGSNKAWGEISFQRVSFWKQISSNGIDERTKLLNTLELRASCAKSYTAMKKGLPRIMNESADGSHGKRAADIAARVSLGEPSLMICCHWVKRQLGLLATTSIWSPKRLEAPPMCYTQSSARHGLRQADVAFEFDLKLIVVASQLVQKDCAVSASPSSGKCFFSGNISLMYWSWDAQFSERVHITQLRYFIFVPFNESDKGSEHVKS